MVLDTEHSQERRRLKRVTIKLPVTIEGIGVPKFTCETLNLHEQGMAVTSTTFLTEGSKVRRHHRFPALVNRHRRHGGLVDRAEYHGAQAHALRSRF